MQFVVGGSAQATGRVCHELHGDYVVATVAADEVTLNAPARPSVHLRPRHMWLNRMNAGGAIEVVDVWTTCNVIVDNEHVCMAHCFMSSGDVLRVELDL